MFTPIKAQTLTPPAGCAYWTEDSRARFPRAATKPARAAGGRAAHVRGLPRGRARAGVRVCTCVRPRVRTRAASSVRHVRHAGAEREHRQGDAPAAAVGGHVRVHAVGHALQQARAARLHAAHGEAQRARVRGGGALRPGRRGQQRRRCGTAQVRGAHARARVEDAIRTPTTHTDTDTDTDTDTHTHTLAKERGRTAARQWRLRRSAARWWAARREKRGRRRCARNAPRSRRCRRRRSGCRRTTS